MEEEDQIEDQLNTAELDILLKTDNDSNKEIPTSQIDYPESQTYQNTSEEYVLNNKKRQKANKAIKNKEKISPFLQPPFPPHPIRQPPSNQNISKSQYKRHEVLPPLPENTKDNNNLASSNCQENVNNQKSYVKQSEIPISDDYKKRAAYLEKKNKVYVQKLNNNYVKKIPLDPYKENQSEKWLNITKKSCQLTRKKGHCRQSTKLPPMAEIEQNEDEDSQPELPCMDQLAESLIANDNDEDQDQED